MHVKLTATDEDQGERDNDDDDDDNFAVGNRICILQGMTDILVHLSVSLSWEKFPLKMKSQTEDQVSSTFLCLMELMSL